MRIGLIGYGKMGKTIEKIAIKRGHSIVSKIDAHNAGEIDRLQDKNIDVAIEFTVPEAAFDLIHRAIEQGIPVVSGTTGWLDKLEQIKTLCSLKNAAFFYASNFSIGANLFFEINRKLADLMNDKGYNTQLEEIHHTEKKDAPSGTAITLAEDILQFNKQLKHWVSGTSDNKSTLPIKSLRKSDVPGTHAITYASAYDKIQIKHTAFSREGFAEGAVLAAEWLQGKTGVFTMKDFLKT